MVFYAVKETKFCVACLLTMLTPSSLRVQASSVGSKLVSCKPRVVTKTAEEKVDDAVQSSASYFAELLEKHLIHEIPLAKEPGAKWPHAIQEKHTVLEVDGPQAGGNNDKEKSAFVMTQKVMRTYNEKEHPDFVIRENSEDQQLAILKQILYCYQKTDPMVTYRQEIVEKNGSKQYRLAVLMYPQTTEFELDSTSSTLAKAGVFKDLMIRPGRGRGDVPLLQSHLKLIIVPTFSSKKTSHPNEKDECKIEILTLYPKANTPQTSSNENDQQISFNEEEWGEEEQECEEDTD